jgi:SARP family transcriptional regulator, regulator of embCAB operon
VTDTGIDVRVLGPLQLRVDGVALSPGTPKQRAVLATLVLNRNRAVSTDSLIAAAWEDRPPSEAKAAMYTYIANLRRLFGSAGGRQHSVLASAPPGYRLDIADADCDLGRFSTARSTGVHAAAAGRFDDACAALSEALAQWRGPVLQDLDDFAFVAAFATAMNEEKLLVHEAWAEAAIACGRSTAVIGELEGLIAAHPYREPLWAQLITAYYVAGRQADALNAYRRVKATLAEDLGIDPSSQLRVLQQRILNQEDLDVAHVARRSAVATATAFDRRTRTADRSLAGSLREVSGPRHPLEEAVTRIGRLGDNDIVLADANVSRHHAVVIDSGTAFAIADLGSANGVYVAGERIVAPVTLSEGDLIRICDHEFVFELGG